MSYDNPEGDREAYCPWCERVILNIWTNIRVGNYYVGIHPECMRPWTLAGQPAHNPNGKRMDGTIEAPAANSLPDCGPEAS